MKKTRYSKLPGVSQMTAPKPAPLPSTAGHYKPGVTLPFMPGTLANIVADPSPLKPDAQSIQSNNDVKGKTSSQPLKPNSSGE